MVRLAAAVYAGTFHVCVRGVYIFAPKVLHCVFVMSTYDAAARCYYESDYVLVIKSRRWKSCSKFLSNCIYYRAGQLDCPSSS